MNQQEELMRLREVLRVAKAIMEWADQYQWQGLVTIPLDTGRIGWLRDALRDADSANEWCND